MSILGQKLRKLRKERRMTQAELADGLVTASMISQIEGSRATPSTELLEQLAVRLGVGPEYLIDEVQTQSDQTQRYRQAQALIDLQRYDDAIPILKDLLGEANLQIKLVNLYNDLANCYSEMDRIPEAMEMLDESISYALARDEVTTAVHIYFEAGRIQRVHQHYQNALMFWRRAQELINRHPKNRMPVSLRIALNLGRVGLQLGDYALAKSSYEQALILADEFYAPRELGGIHHGLATAYVGTSQYNLAYLETKAAIREYEASENNRGILQCSINLAVLLRLEGRYEAAIKSLSSLLNDTHRGGNRSPDALVERAQSYLELKAMDKAIEDVWLAKDWDKDNTPSTQLPVHTVLAHAYFQKGELALALDHARIASDIASAIALREKETQLVQLRYQICTALNDNAGILDAAKALVKLVESHNIA